MKNKFEVDVWVEDPTCRDAIVDRLMLHPEVRTATVVFPDETEDDELARCLLVEIITSDVETTLSSIRTQEGIRSAAVVSSRHLIW